MSTVLLDTDVYSYLYLQQKRTVPHLERWRTTVAGRRLVIAIQTRAELLVGIHASSWGEPRQRAALADLERVAGIPVTDEVVQSYVQLTVECRRAGHGLAQKVHTADRWVAATAIAAGVPLAAGDGIYVDAPGLTLLAAPPATTVEAS